MQYLLADISVKGVFGTFVKYLSALLPILMGAATIVFIWGVIRFIAYAGNLEERKRGKNLIIWGLVGLFVIVTLWGLVYFVLNSLFGGIPNSPANWPPKFYP